MHSSTAVLAAAGMVCCALSGCSTDGAEINVPTVSRTALQQDISERLADAGERPESVVCKQDLVGELGKTAHCEVVVSASNRFEPVITVTGVDGAAINYEMTPALSQQQLEQTVSRLVADAGAPDVKSVSCDSGLEGRMGMAAHCDVDSDGVRLRRTIEVASVDGLMMKFDVVPLLTRSEVENSLLDDLESQFGRRPDAATCSDSLEGKPGNTVDCTVVAGPTTERYTLTVSTVDGTKINYSYEPKS
jgi:uncharacterized protein DUF4333